MSSNFYYGYKPEFFVNPEEVIPELKKHILVDGYDIVIDLEKSKGAELRDARTQKSFVDFFSYFASMPLGMNHPKMFNNDFINYIGQVALNKISNSDIYSQIKATFAKTFFNIAVPDTFKYLFLIDGGALAVENALKAAFDWKVRQNLRNGYTIERGSKIIHFKEAFHGRSGYTMSLTNTDPNKIDYFPKFDWPRIINPKLHFPITENNLIDTIETENIAIEQIKKAFMEHPDDIAAIIIEPIQAEGGDNHFRSEFFRNLRELADENNCLLIFDEVQTGLGLTGKWWAFQHFDVVPDILIFGKKMQVCGILSTNRIDSEPVNVFNKSSRINSTWGGNIVDMARATRYLEIIREENLVENAGVMGNYFISKLNELNMKYPDKVFNVRGKGLMLAFDTISVEYRNKLVKDAFDNGLIILSCGNKSIRFRPALDINTDAIDKGMEILEGVLSF